MKKQSLTQLISASGWILLWLSSSEAAASNLENLAKSLAKIRGEVETLQTQLDTEKDKHTSKMTALSSQIADLSVEERRQKLSIEKLQHSIDKMTENAKKSEQSGEHLKPVLLSVLNDYKSYTQTGFPFKTEDRMKVIHDLENNITHQVMDPNKATNHAWALIEDELRLSKENGIYQQTITLNGEQVLAEVAKLGTIFLFFQTRDQRSGMAKKTSDDHWKFEVVEDNEEIERIKSLFDSLKKQIRQGYFEIPNPLRK
ncbi:DUF3450 family protein [Nitrosomonas sp. JL21]|uniref:DUF3450 family protein n=1 Tax=Nitrosomonas sp. JL21 TaxID=153949 RepID=UPI00136C227A|nr:DUF3450 family protein [Nitrosomonas sp. JL21]MBL8496260.1 DUF3450 family protein [Nitrosomonas sp.]MCC7092243.1 DUF3450 family protein [Nitrosomonas sp.]MXS76973.1 DUF3450 family protein [Nitrosomonas sp. JL21]